MRLRFTSLAAALAALPGCAAVPAPPPVTAEAPFASIGRGTVSAADPRAAEAGA
jgi:hypothetical protein